MPSSASLGTGLSLFREVSLQTVATRAIVTAMTRNGVRRLVSISVLVVGGQPSRRLRVRQLTRLGRRPGRHAYQ
jgi:hypothetical protein